MLLYTFLFFQTILLFVYFKDSKTDENFAFKRFFPNKLTYSASIFASIILADNFNATYQIYCIPVLWVKVLLSFLLFILVAYPYLPETEKWQHFKCSYWGFMVFVALYLILFAGISEFLFLSIVFGIIFLAAWGISYKGNEITQSRKFIALKYITWCAYLPFLILWLAFNSTFKQNNLSKDANIFWPSYQEHIKNIHKFFWIGLLIPLFLCIFSTYKINKTVDDLALNPELTIEKYISNPIDKYYLELTLGSGLIYHTESVIGIDGWRSPFHDPILGFACMFLFNKKEYFSWQNFKKRGLYEKAFPDNQIDYECRCAEKERIFE
jgi:hypothetical protein